MNSIPTGRANPDIQWYGLYPGLCVHDGRVSGSITIGRTRLPLWAILPTLIEEDWEAVREHGPSVDDYDWTVQDTGRFLR